MAKQALIDRAIAQLESEKAVLELAIARLKAQQVKVPAKPRLKAVKDETA